MPPIQQHHRVGGDYPPQSWILQPQWDWWQWNMSFCDGGLVMRLLLQPATKHTCTLCRVLSPAWAVHSTSFFPMTCVCSMHSNGPPGFCSQLNVMLPVVIKDDRRYLRPKVINDVEKWISGIGWSTGQMSTSKPQSVNSTYLYCSRSSPQYSNSSVVAHEDNLLDIWNHHKYPGTRTWLENRRLERDKIR